MSILLEIKVTPNAGKQALNYDKNNTIKCYLKSAPESGKANAELIKFLSKKLNVAQNNVEIVRGATSRSKLIKIDTKRSKEEILLELGLEVQMTI
ncbi:DUF167 domain-containing protein [Candidatus Babeliales bacterium]|nr:DUF167 domain-containing protein [Candidatus Babeliales bacterium]MBY0353558.1 DUF167 domain-containing protein [Candidatus Babeliales bacterium]